MITNSILSQIQYEDTLTKLDYIRQNISEPAMLELLAEEASELSQAALKKARILRKENPTPVTLTQARKNLDEELTDVAVCASILNLYIDETILIRKYHRMFKRLEDAKKNDKLVQFIDYTQDDIDEWTKEYVESHKDSGLTALETFAETLVDEQPYGYDTSHAIAKMIFDALVTERHKESLDNANA